MMKEFEHTGFWYLPQKPGTSIPGTLKFMPATGAVLDLIGYFEDERPPTSPLAPEIILGQSSDGREVTLRGCREVDRWLGSTPVQTSRFVAEMVLTGAHLARPDSLTFKSVSVRYAHLDEWAGMRGFSFEPLGSPPLTDGITVKYDRPRSVRVEIPDGYTLEVGADFSCPMHARRVTVEQSTTMALENREARSLDEYLRVVRRLEAFLSLAVSEPCPPTRIRGILAVSGGEGGAATGSSVDIACPLGDVPGARRELIPKDMLFTLPDMVEGLPSFVGNWLARAEMLEPVWDLYAGTLYSPGMYLSHRFLSLAHAVEAYHRRAIGGSELPEDQHEKRLEGILGGCPHEHADWLREKLRYTNELSLRARLNKICETHGALLSSLKLQQGSFIERVVATRNYLTHLDPKLQKGAARGEDLHRLGLNLKILLEACLLAEMGFSEDEMMGFFKRNRRYRRLM